LVVYSTTRMCIFYSTPSFAYLFDRFYLSSFLSPVALSSSRAVPFTPSIEIFFPAWPVASTHLSRKLPVDTGILLSSQLQSRSGLQSRCWCNCLLHIETSYFSSLIFSTYEFVIHSLQHLVWHFLKSGIRLIAFLIGSLESMPYGPSYVTCLDVSGI